MLDRVSAAVASALAVRRLRAGYTGPLIRVRRSSDNTQLDIGSAFAIEPNIVTNGSFATDTFWTKGTGVTISGGLANCSGAAQIVTANIGMIPGRRYAIQFDFTCISGAALRVNNSLVNEANVKYTQAVANGTSGTIRCDFVADNSQFAIEAHNATFTGTIDNVVVNPVLAVGGDLDTAALLTHVFSSPNVLGDATGYAVLNGATYTPNSPAIGSLRLIEDTSSGFHRIRKFVSGQLVSGTQHRIATVITTVGSERGVMLEFNGAGLGLYVKFQLSAGIVENLGSPGLSGVSGTITNVGANTWRCEIVFTPNSTYTNPEFVLTLIPPTGTGDTRNYVGDGSSGVTAIAPAVFTSVYPFDAFIVTQYAQTAGGINVTQANTALQPWIVRNGLLETQNGRPALYTTGTQFLAASGSLGINLEPMTLSAVGRTLGGGGRGLVGTGNSTNNYNQVRFDNMAPVAGRWNGAGWVSVVGSTLASEMHVLTNTIDASRLSTLFVNGTSVGTPATYGAAAGPVDRMAFCSSEGSFSLSHNNGWTAEAIVFGSALSTIDRQAISRQQGAYYGVTVS